MRVLILGASENPDRYAYKALTLLLEQSHKVFLKGLKPGIVLGLTINTGSTVFDSIHTVILYIGANNQSELLDYLEKLKPKRVIFNPGTENPELYAEIEKLNICVEEACTLVLLHTNQF